MLLRLVRTRLVPYKGPIAAIVTLQLIGTLAMLYLPSINAEIIDKGVVTGDTGFIIERGVLMLAISLAQALCSVVAVWFAALRRWVSAATCAPRSSSGSARSRPARSSTSAPRR